MQNTLVKSIQELHPEHMSDTVIENTIASLRMIAGFNHFGKKIQKLAAEKLDMLIQHNVEKLVKEEQKEIEKKKSQKSPYPNYEYLMGDIDSKLQLAQEQGLEVVEINDTLWEYNKDIKCWEPKYE